MDITGYTWFHKDNSPMVGATVACAVAVEEANKLGLQTRMNTGFIPKKSCLLGGSFFAFKTRVVG